MKYLLFLCFIVTSLGLTSSHVAGGHFSIENNGGGDFVIKFFGYTDCENGEGSFSFFPLVVDIYDSFMDTVITNFDMSYGGTYTSGNVSLGDQCYSPNLCVVEHKYKKSVSLPPVSTSYYITFDICCRNIIIDNIIYPNFQGNTFFAEFSSDSLALNNSPPVFKTINPGEYFCVTETKCFDLSASDVNGDSLVYSLETPFTNDGNGKPIDQLTWETGFSNINPIAGDVFSLNPNTGELCAKASSLGVYIFTVKVKEYRNGVCIGELYKDYQWASLLCDKPENTIKLFSKNNNQLYMNESYCFDIVALDTAGFNDTLLLQVTSDLSDFGGEVFLPDPILGTTNDYLFDVYDNDEYINQEEISVVANIGNTIYKGSKKVGVSFCITPHDCDIFNEEELFVGLKVYSNTCIGTDTLYRRIQFKMNYKDSLLPLSNVITPNDDGINDFYTASTLLSDCFILKDAVIYNRWGGILFKQEIGNDIIWKGEDQFGNKVAPGVYFLVINGEYNGKAISRKTSISVFF